MPTYRFVLRRGNTAAVAVDVPMVGELLLDTTTRSITVGDGITAGGSPIAKASVGLGNVTNDAQIKASQLETDTYLGSNSDARVPSTKAVRAYVAANAGSGGASSLPGLQRGLVFWWGGASDFREATTLSELEVLGSPATSTGPGGGDAALWSAAGRLLLQARPQLNPGYASFTVAAWVRFTTIPVLTSGLVCRSDVSTRTWEMQRNSAGPFQFRVGSTTVNSSVTPTAGTWYHVICTRDAIANTISIAVNGGISQSTAFNRTAEVTSALPLSIGGFAVAGNDLFSGTICDVGYWVRSLTATERAALYASGTGLRWPLG